MLRNLVKLSLPEQMRFIALFVWKCLRPYNEMDNTDFWKGRSKEHGQKAVLWKNENYNNLMRKIQREKLAPLVSKLKKNSHVLDVGCGIGIVTAMMLEINPSIFIDSLDFPEMIKKARMLYKDTERVNWIASSAESYLEPNRYDLIVSSGAYSAIRDDIKRLRAMENAAKMLKISPYFVSDYQRAAANYPMRKVAQVISYLRDADVKNKGVGASSMTQADILKQLLFKIMH